MIRTQKIVLQDKDLSQLIQAYRTLEDLLSRYIRKEDLYTKSFIKGIEQSLREVKRGKTKAVKIFDEFAA